MRIKYLPQCDNDDDNHLYCHSNHCASPSPTLWLPARHLFCVLQFLSIHCLSFHREEGGAWRGETYTFTVTHSVRVQLGFHSKSDSRALSDLCLPKFLATTPVWPSRRRNREQHSGHPYGIRIRVC